MEWMILPLKRYADFNGRSRRMEYWMFALFQLVLIIGLILVTIALGSLGKGNELGVAGVISMTLMFVVMLGLFIPALAVQVRRLHDQDKSGLFILVSFIPAVGGIIMMVLMCIDGTPGENQYGPDPKGRGGFGADAFR